MPRPKSQQRPALARISNSSEKPSTWLVGSWRSDKEATMQAWGDYPPGSPAFQTLLTDGLGKLAIRYTAKRSYSSSEGLESVASYKVVWENEDSLFLVYGRRNEEQGQYIVFTSPQQYRVQVGRYVEFFSKQRDA
jgi:hypothetical protein